MTDTLARLDLSATEAAREPDGFGRVAAIAGIASVAIGLTAFPLLGSVSMLGDSAADVAAYFAKSGGTHEVAVVIAALISIPFAIFFSGIHHWLASSRARSRGGWATAFLFGAVMMSATAGLRERPGGVLATVAFPVMLIWMLATGIAMLRRPLVP